ncbi:MAG: DUF4879 domain-containing protein [Planctomycetaceae bacterium]|nr:DUF4879 domain-containing protein [Planctomycetaceae bacterium]
MSRLFAAFVAMMIATQPVVAAPAPAVSYYQIYAVRSAQSSGTWEYPKSSDVVTTWDHGGSYIDVAVYQRGYSSSRQAKMDTYGMSLVETLYDKDSSGAIVGFYYIFRIQKGFASGTVSSSAISINTGRAWSDSIRIK